jgi:hypothetical protein
MPFLVLHTPFFTSIVGGRKQKSAYEIVVWDAVAIEFSISNTKAFWLAPWGNACFMAYASQ